MMNRAVPAEEADFHLLPTGDGTAEFRGVRKDRPPFRVDFKEAGTPLDWQLKRSEARTLVARFIIRLSREEFENQKPMEAA